MTTTLSYLLILLAIIAEAVGDNSLAQNTFLFAIAIAVVDSNYELKKSLYGGGAN